MLAPVPPELIKLQLCIGTTIKGSLWEIYLKNVQDRFFKTNESTHLEAEYPHLWVSKKIFQNSVLNIFCIIQL